MPYLPTQSDDHVDRGPGRFIQQYKNQPNLTALLRSYLGLVQDLEDAAWEVARVRNIKDGFGIILDYIGKIVGRRREGLIDSDYRIALYTQIRINRTKGRPEDVIDVTRLSLPDDAAFSYTEDYPAGIIIEILNPAPVVFKINILSRNLHKTKAGGVRLWLCYTTDPADDLFLWADHQDDYSIEAFDLDKGLGWDPSPVLGGKLIMIEVT